MFFNVFLFSLKGYSETLRETIYQYFARVNKYCINGISWVLNQWLDALSNLIYKRAILWDTNP